MSYESHMLESIRKVEATRTRRKSEKFPMLSQDERKDILNRFHPDFKDDVFRKIAVGPNKDGRAPKEFVDLVEARPWIDPDSFPLNTVDYDVDVLVIGGGGAGACAALVATERGAKVLLVTKLRLGDSNTMMAQGGIQAASKSIDSPAIHYLDVMGGGRYTNDPALVRALVMDAPGIVKWHEELGVMYDKEPDGTLKVIHGGGTSRKRMHAARDYTGAEIMRTLRDEVRNKCIPVLEFTSAIELIKDKSGHCAGAVCFNLETEEYHIVRAKSTVIATGGFGRLHIQGFPTTNHYGATADGVLMAYKAGAPFVFLDKVQYHPTGAAYPEQILGQLITEKVRGLGAQVCNIEGEQFIFPLETRDVEAAGFIRECKERDKGIATSTGMIGVWLDSPLIDLIHGEGTVHKRLPAMVRQYMRFGIDIAKLPILTYPTLHYQNGGVKINEKCETAVPGLYVAGEAAGGVHGGNRLMGNSLLDVNVFGKRAGKFAAEHAKKARVGELTLAHVKSHDKALAEAGIKSDRKAPLVLPDYRRPETLKKRVSIMCE